MENIPTPVSPATPPPEETVEIQEFQPRFKIENITVAKPPLLKIYYWKSLDMEK